MLNGLGSTRSCYRSTHLLQTPDTFVRAALPEMMKGTAIIHAAPAIGARFTEYTAEMEAGGSLNSNGLERFLWVLDGNFQVELPAQSINMEPGFYCYLPPDDTHRIHAETTCRFVVIEKLYEELEATDKPAFFSASISTTAANPLMGDPSVRVQMLIPETPAFDFAVNLMTFELGAALSMVEIHVMEHGLLLLQGGGIYRLADCWHPVTAGDFIWMAPYCPQWFGAIGKRPAQYLIYKDWNRAPKG